MDDEQLAARRAEIPVHCGGCGATFPGDTQLNNGLCRECCRSPIHLIRQVERLKRENAILRAAVRLAAGLLADPQRAEINALLDRAEDNDG